MKMKLSGMNPAQVADELAEWLRVTGIQYIDFDTETLTTKNELITYHLAQFMSTIHTQLCHDHDHYAEQLDGLAGLKINITGFGPGVGDLKEGLAAAISEAVNEFMRQNPEHKVSKIEI